MTIVALNGKFYPGIAPLSSGAAITSVTIDAAGEKSSLVFNPPRAGNIRKIHWGTRTVTTGDTVDVRVETVSGGTPTGTLWAANTNASQVILATDDNAQFATTLTADATVVLDSLVAIVIVCATGNLQVAACSQFMKTIPTGSSIPPKGVTYTTSWADTSSPPAMCVEYDDGEIWPCYPGAALAIEYTGYNINSGTTPDEVGNVFVPSISCKVIGFVTSIQIGSGALPVFDLMDSSNNVLATATLSNEYRTTGSVNSQHNFGSEATLTAGQTYRITMRPDSATNCNISAYFKFPSGVKLSGFTSMQRTERTNAGAWTDDSTRIAMLFPVLSAVDDGASTGGGLLTHPGMSGGMRG